MKTIETEMPFCKSLSSWVRLRVLGFAMFLAAHAWLAPKVWAQSTYEPSTFTTFTGDADHGRSDGTGSAGRFNQPRGPALDTSGNVYVADTGINTIPKAT